jgi:AAA+ superfamily predicted ATPase
MLFDAPSWDALAPQRPLRFWRLLEINQPGATPLTASPLRADERIVSYLKGLNALDDRLAQWLLPQPELRATLANSQRAVAERVVQQLVHASANAALPVVQLLGADLASKRLVAGHIATTLRRELCVIDASALPVALGELENLARLWQRESLLLPLALFVDGQSGGGEAAPEVQTRIERFLQRVAFGDGNCVVLLGVREALPQVATASLGLSLNVDVNKPTAQEQRAAWQATLNDAFAAQQLAGQFDLNLHELEALAHGAEEGDAEVRNAQLWRACADLTRPRMDALAQRLSLKATWDDLVLGDETTQLLRLIAEQVRQRSRVYEDWGFGAKMNRGLGISALFAGESGTGKTMAAEVIANDLRMNLYRIDLSAVVSKYIGETEKNLRRVFDAAEVGGAILFFDEADALFGKRSEVKDSHDRYANIEINYLLQRMEAYRGLAILATNMKSALDAAFMRRLRFIVNFSFPGAAERKRMWQKAFPQQVPTAQLDFDKLARLNVTGGNIHSIALNAAFLAARSGGSAELTMGDVLAAARMEFRKLDKPLGGELRMENAE